MVNLRHHKPDIGKEGWWYLSRVELWACHIPAVCLHQPLLRDKRKHGVI